METAIAPDCETTEAPDFETVKPGFRLVFPAILAAVGVAALDSNIVTAALPVISSDLGGLNQLFWIITAFMLAQSATLLLYGKFGDLYGRRPLYLFAITVFLFGSAICGLATSMLVLILGRAAQGVGAAGLLSLGSATMADFVAPRERGRYQGMISGCMALASLAGPVVGGLITNTVGWRWVFLINLPLGLIVGFLVIRGLPKRAIRSSDPIDLLGGFFVLTAPVTSLLAITYAGTRGFGDPLVLALGAGGVALIAALIWQERRCAYPILDLSLFRDAVFSRCALTIALVAFSFFGAVAFMPLYLQMVRGANPASAGAIMMPQLIGLLFSSVLGGRLLTRLGRYKGFIVCGVSLHGSTLVVIGLLIVYAAPLPLLLAALLSLGIAGGLAMPTITLAAQSTVNRHQLGAATSMMAFCHAVSAATGVAISGTIITARERGYLSARMPATVADQLSHIGVRQLAQMEPAVKLLVQAAYQHAISLAFLTSGGTMLVTALIALSIPDRMLSQRED